jgi:hypothetical protein
MRSAQTSKRAEGISLAALEEQVHDGGKSH